MLIDLTGMRFGKLVVLKRAENLISGGQARPRWECQCDCGNITITWGQSLRNGVTKSCGCGQHPGPSPTVHPGERYGKLVVLAQDGYNKHGQRKYLMRCDCGNEFSTCGNSLRQGHTKTCGKCYKPAAVLIDLTGKQLGSLKIVGRSATSKWGEATWDCVCECGLNCTFASRSIRRMLRPNCGKPFTDDGTIRCQAAYLRRHGVRGTSDNPGGLVVDLTGQRFGKLVVLEKTSHWMKGQSYGWSCLCDCGNKCVVAAHKLRFQGVQDCGCEKANFSSALTEWERNIFYGTLLGDGGLRRSPNYASLRINHCEAQKDYVFWLYEQLKRFVDTPPCWHSNRDGYGGPQWRFNTTGFESMRSAYDTIYCGAEGRKTVGMNWLDEIDHPVGLAVWYMDDGSCASDTYSCNIATHSFSKQENELLVEWLAYEWGIKDVKVRHGTKLNKNTGREAEYWWLGLNKDARDDFFDLIKSFVLPCMQYKLTKQFRGACQLI